MLNSFSEISTASQSQKYQSCGVLYNSSRAASYLAVINTLVYNNTLLLAAAFKPNDLFNTTYSI
jgi:hypothetical protein